LWVSLSCRLPRHIAILIAILSAKIILSWDTYPICFLQLDWFISLEVVPLIIISPFCCWRVSVIESTSIVFPEPDSSTIAIELSKGILRDILLIPRVLL